MRRHSGGEGILHFGTFPTGSCEFLDACVPEDGGSFSSTLKMMMFFGLLLRDLCVLLWRRVFEDDGGVVEVDIGIMHVLKDCCELVWNMMHDLGHVPEVEDGFLKNLVWIYFLGRP